MCFIKDCKCDIPCEMSKEKRAIISKATVDLFDGKKLFFSFRVCKELQRDLKPIFGDHIVIGFESSRNKHTPYLTVSR
jgi:hypothetical protein